VAGRQQRKDRVRPERAAGQLQHRYRQHGLLSTILQAERDLLSHMQPPACCCVLFYVQAADAAGLPVLQSSTGTC
jgi:hypothetical protein